MSPFDKRVQLLEKWHTQNPSINADDLAELILEVWQIAEGDTEERIIKLLIDNAIELRWADLHQQANYLDFAIELIKGEQKKIIHTHEIEVFGSPCDCGTRHEYCGECDWVEPCEPEGEQK